MQSFPAPPDSGQPAIALVLINLRDTGGRLPGDAVRIDRKTRWGNPYVITEDTPRDEVLRRYRAFLWGRICSGGIALKDLAKLHGKSLACWCHPKPCHGSVLAEAAAWADWAVRNNVEKLPAHASGIAPENAPNRPATAGALPPDGPRPRGSDRRPTTDTDRS